MCPSPGSSTGRLAAPATQLWAPSRRPSASAACRGWNPWRTSRRWSGPCRQVAQVVQVAGRRERNCGFGEGVVVLCRREGRSGLPVLAAWPQSCTRHSRPVSSVRSMQPVRPLCSPHAHGPAPGSPLSTPNAAPPQPRVSVYVLPHPIPPGPLPARLGSAPQEAYGEAAFEYFPRSYVLPSQYWVWRSWTQRTGSPNDLPWVLKRNDHRGRGVKVMRQQQVRTV
jgi:hypothetical protein